MHCFIKKGGGKINLCSSTYDLRELPEMEPIEVRCVIEGRVFGGGKNTRQLLFVKDNTMKVIRQNGHHSGGQGQGGVQGETP